MRKNGNTTAYRESLRQRILSTAMPLFKRKGVKAVKMDDIATEMAISKRTLYEIYSNKEDLLYECVKYDSEKMVMQIAEYAKSVDNEMDVIAYYLKMRIRDLGQVNPCFFIEVHKYTRIVNYLRKNNERQNTNSYLFIQKGIEHGFFRENINYEIVHEIGDAAMDYVMRSKMYQKYSLKDIFRTFIVVYMRGCCTEKGLKYLAESMDDIKQTE